MANSIYGLNSIYGVNGIYGINRYRNYLSNYTGNQSNSLSNVLSSAVVANAALRLKASGTQSSAGSSYLSQMNNSLNSMYLANAATMLSSKKVTATDAAAVTGTARINAAVKGYAVKISSLAAGQVNEGTKLDTVAASTMQKGLNSIKVRSGYSEKTVSFIVNEGDTNKTALNKLASAINNSDVGIKASVETSSDNEVSLKLESTKTGTKNAFYLSDIRGNAVSIAGLSNTLTKAQDAVYSVDGRQYTSSSNTVSLDSGKVQLTLKKADNKEFGLNIAPDTTNSTVPDFYSYFNNLLSAGNYYNSTASSGNLLDMFL